MCGIGGFMRYGETPIDPYDVQALLCNLEKRGNHATGIALAFDDGKVVVKKAPVPAWEFTIDEDWAQFCKEYLENSKYYPRIALLHTRWATIGNPNDNKNNHPIFAGQGAVTHNGSASNHHSLFSSLKLERKAEVDSDIIRAIIDRDGITKKAIETLNAISGACAIAAVHPAHPQKLLLGKSGKPLVLGWHEESQMLAWASEKEILYNATRPVYYKQGFPFGNNRSEYAFYTVPKDSMYIIGMKGKEFYAEFKSAPYTNSDGNDIIYRCNENYHETRSRFDKEIPPKKKVVVVQEGPLYINAKLHKLRCRNEVCKVVITLEKDQLEIPLYELYCTKCGTYLMDEPAVKQGKKDA